MLDLLVIGVIIVCGIIGLKLGFIKTIYQFISSLVALVLAIMVAPVIEGILKLTPLYTSIQAWFLKMLPSFEATLPKQSENAAIREATSWLPQMLTDQIVANNNPEIYALLGVDKLVDYMIMSLTNLCITGLAVVSAWIIIKVLLSIGVGILDLVAKLPILKTANQLAGFVVGLVKGVLFVWIGCLLVPALVLIPSLAQIQQLIEASFLTKILYDYNIVLQVISNVLVK